MVDFFFTLPDKRAAARRLRFLLAGEGFEAVNHGANAKAAATASTCSARMRLVVPEMQALTARFRQLAEERGGSYDSWAVGRQREG